MRTGDKGSYDKDGEVVVTDRMNEVIKYKHYQISPIEIEGILMSHPHVLEVAVLPVPNDKDNERPLAIVRKVENSEVCKKKIIFF